MKSDLIEKIKSRGYWRINFQPLVAVQKLKNLSDCKNLVEKNSVVLRGWDYPHFPNRSDEKTGLEPGNNYYQGWIDWWSHKEFWRMYQSGQFFHYLGLREDWYEEDGWFGDTAKEIKPGSSLSVVGTIYQITEIYEFLARLARDGIYEEGVDVNISFNNTLNRKLWLDDLKRAPFSYDRKTGAEKIEIPPHKYKKDKIVNQARDLALEIIIYIFDRFDWPQPPVETIKRDQDNLLSRRF